MKNLKIILLFAALLSVAATGSAQTGKSSGEGRTDAPAQVTAQAIPPQTPDDYVIGPEDVLLVNVWKEPDFTATVPVRPDGKISLSLVHDIQAAGLTPIALSKSIATELKRYVSEPRVTVVVTAMNSRRVYLVGEVSRPGAVPLGSNVTVLQMISSAGGFSPFANLKNIYVLRTEEGKQKKYPVNYKQLLKGENQAQNIVLKPGDTIVVP
jgi:polysaccharide biosynthesis/export protein